MIRCLKLLLAAALLPSVAVPASAGVWDSISQFKKPNMKLGRLAIHPYLKLSEMYDSNIFLQPKSHVAGNNANGNQAGPVLGSWIHATNAGAKLDLPVADMHRFALGYDFSYLAYSKDPRTNNAVHQTADIAYKYKGPFGLAGGLVDRYMNTTDPATTELVRRNKRWQNAAAGFLEYAPEGGVLFAGVDFGHTTHKYIGHPDAVTLNLPLLLNRYEQSAGVKGGYMLAPKTRLYAAYHRQIIHYTVKRPSPTKNNKSHLFDVGVEGNIAPKLTGKIEAGFAYRRYDDENSAAGVNIRSRIYRTWAVATKLAYKPLERTTVNLALSRGLQEATFANNRFYASSSANLSATHKLPYKLTAGVNGGVTIDKYPEATTPALGGLTRNRRDDSYQEGASLDYDIQEWLRTGVSYLHRHKHSVFTEQFNYNDHQTMASVAVTF